MGIDYDRSVFAKNLSIYLERADMTSSDLARSVNVSKTIVSEWINGKKIPRWNKIEELSQFFNINISDLIEDKTHIQKTGRGIKIPIVGKVAAGVPIEAIKDIIDYEEIPQELARTGDYFGLKIQGDSMWPEIMDGDIAIVRQQPDCESGDTAVIIVNGQDATVKRIKKRPEGIILISNNHNYEPMLFNNDDIKNMPLTICGKVVEIRRKL